MASPFVQVGLVLNVGCGPSEQLVSVDQSPEDLSMEQLHCQSLCPVGLGCVPSEQVLSVD